MISKEQLKTYKKLTSYERNMRIAYNLIEQSALDKSKDIRLSAYNFQGRKYRTKKFLKHLQKELTDLNFTVRFLSSPFGNAYLLVQLT